MVLSAPTLEILDANNERIQKEMEMFESIMKKRQDIIYKRDEEILNKAKEEKVAGLKKSLRAKIGKFHHFSMQEKIGYAQNRNENKHFIDTEDSELF